MKSPAHFVGKPSVELQLMKIFIILIAIILVAPVSRAQTYDAVDLEGPEAPARYQPPNTTKWILFSAAEAATVFFVSQTQNGPLIFGGLYAAGTLFFLRETLYGRDDESLDLFLPFGMLTMSVLNFALLNYSSRFSYGTVCTYNLAGAAILTAYAWWDADRRGGRHRAYTFLPMIDNTQAGVIWQHEI